MVQLGSLLPIQAPQLSERACENEPRASYSAHPIMLFRAPDSAIPRTDSAIPHAANAIPVAIPHRSVAIPAIPRGRLLFQVLFPHMWAVIACYYPSDYTCYY